MSREIFDLPPYSEIWKDTKKRTPLGERELLVHALDRLKHINFEDDHLTNDLIQTIQKYLDQPEHTEQEPFDWETKKKSYLDERDRLGMEANKAQEEIDRLTDLLFSKPATYIDETQWMQVPEPLSDEAICQILLKKEWKGFVELVRIIEKMHGIGGGE